MKTNITVLFILSFLSTIVCAQEGQYSERSSSVSSSGDNSASSSTGSSGVGIVVGENYVLKS
ncbi:MAG: hypothetical protein ACI81V_000602, partial [Lentimonas sp.]